MQIILNYVSVFRAETPPNAKIRQIEIKLPPPPSTQICVSVVVSVLKQTAPYLVFTVLADEQPNLKAT